MNKKKLSFAVENIRLSEDDVDRSNFALLDVDAFSTGRSLHNTFVTEEVLRNTARTILLKPFVFSISKIFNDLGSHDINEVIGGFVPHNSPIEFKQMGDGRIMLSCQVLVWRKYCGKLLEYFERDGNKKAVSVEIEVYDERIREDGLIELLDFSYQALTALGDAIRPAIKNAQAVLRFSKEYKMDLLQEFGKYDSIDMTIPSMIKESAEEALNLYKIYGRGGNSFSLSIARDIISNDKISLERIRQIAKRKPKQNNLSDKSSEEYISNGLYGSIKAYEWSNEILKKIDEIDEKNISYFSQLSDMSPVLKKIDPPVTVSQANSISRQADIIESDGEKNKWDVAISLFKKMHHVENGKWVKNENKESGNMENFALKKEDWGSGEKLLVDKSKDAVSERAWGDVDKSDLMEKVLKSSNYREIIKDVYMKVESGWENAPSSHLKYPVMCISGGKLVYNRYGLASALAYAKKEGENEVVNKINNIYNKLELNKEKDDEKEELAVYDKNAELEAKKEEDEKGSEKEEFSETNKEKEMSLEGNLDVSAILALLEDETESYREIVEKEFAKDEQDRDYFSMFMAVCQKMCKISTEFSELKKKHEDINKKFEEADEKLKAYMAENEDLKKFKSDVEHNQFSFEVDATIGEIVSTVEIPQEEIDLLKEQAKNFNLENIDAWKNLCKAKAFSFASKLKKADALDGITKYATPNFDKKDNSKVSIWDNPIFKN